MDEREKHGFPGPGPVNLGSALPQALSARPGLRAAGKGRRRACSHPSPGKIRSSKSQDWEFSHLSVAGEDDGDRVGGERRRIGGKGGKRVGNWRDGGVSPSWDPWAGGCWGRGIP